MEGSIDTLNLHGKRSMSKNHLPYIVPMLLLVRVVLVSGQPSADFINIDCGKAKDYTYNDSLTGLVYTSDFQYVDAGEIHKISPSLAGSTSAFYAQMYDLRSFPEGIRNCYTIRPLKEGGKYLVRASFLYGNYDGEDRLPRFDLHLNVDFWESVSVENSSVNYMYEIMTVVESDKMSVCLVNTGSGTPFVSALELRSLPPDLYPQVNSSHALHLYDRADFGARTETRYPSDPYDRRWLAYSPVGWSVLSTQAPVSNNVGYLPPSDVMKTACYPTLESTLNFSWPVSADFLIRKPRFHIFLHFAELAELKENQTRIFSITLNGRPFFDTIQPSYLKMMTIHTTNPVSYTKLSFVISETNGSTLPPIINAAEVYVVRDTTGLQTENGDVDVVTAIKASYLVKKNWIGDPCSPTTLMWDGLNCSHEGFNFFRIVALNLSSSGLAGEISPSFANLSHLQYLDLSGNELTGVIPDALANLTHLKLLDLSGNRLSTYVPKALLDKAAAGNLTLRTGSTCNGTDNCTKKKSSNKVVIAVIVTVACAVALVMAALIVIFKPFQRACSGNLQSETSTGAQTRVRRSSFRMSSFRLESRQFTSDDLGKITHQFNKEIGRGGFGPVYYGVLGNGAEVAVKMLSKYSSQGPKEFQTEAHLLTRIHHKNLVSLVGYCDDSRSLALVYEYMEEGSLHDHLAGRSSNALSWVQRLRISVDAAQGLEYLHFGCKPSIVHRDVKANNILLDKNLEAKISDFGLSKVFQNDTHSHISTIVVGTPGYVDPEYLRTNQLNEKSDVFSFGIILLQLITGLPAIVSGSGITNLVEWVQERFERGQITEIVDRRICGDCSMSSVWKAVEAAMACVSPAAIQRPTMSDVLILLRDCLETETTEARNKNSIPVNKSIDSSGTLEIPPANTSTIFKPLAR